MQAVCAGGGRGGLVASGGMDRQLCLWSTTETRAAPYSRMLTPAAVTAVSLDSSGAYAATGHADGSLRIWHVPSPEAATEAQRAATDPTAVEGYIRLAAEARLPTADAAAPGGTARVETVAFGPAREDGMPWLAVGGHDRLVHVYELQLPAPAAKGGVRPVGEAWRAASAPRLELVPRGTCRGHGAVVEHVDWSADGRNLISNCSGREAMLWYMPSCQRVASPGSLASDIAWLERGSVYAFDRIGAWSEGAINSAHASAPELEGAPEGLLLTAGDAGRLRLFRAPCVVAAAPYREGAAHLERIAAARFVAGGRRGAVSAGSSDRLLVRWELVAAAEDGSRRG